MPLKTPTFQELQGGVTAVAKQALEDRIDGHADDFRTTVEMDRKRLDETVRLLNESAYALVEQEVGPPGVLAGIAREYVIDA